MRPLAILLLLWAVFSVSAGEPSDPLAVVKGGKGLCLLLGAGVQGSEKLIADLALQSEAMVHGLALDEADLARAQQAITQAKVAGQATVEKVGLKPLPLASDLANWVVVASPERFAGAGLSEAEIWRVTAPLGCVLTRKAQGWEVRVKPMPAEMDSWPQPAHAADANPVSKDKLLPQVLSKPLGLRWQAGLPSNAQGWNATRTWLLAGGRCYSYGVNEVENLPVIRQLTPIMQYLSAVDAFNGLPLWKVPVDNKDDGAVGWASEAPIVADERHVYAGLGQRLVAFEGRSGKELFSTPTQYRPARLIMTEGLIVAACWEGGDWRKKGELIWKPRTNPGNVEAFDVATGAKRWALPVSAWRIIAAAGTLYVVQHDADPPTRVEIIAYDLHSAKERWRKNNLELDSDSGLDVTSAGKGYVGVLAPKERAGKFVMLDNVTGKQLWDAPATPFTLPAVVDDLVWLTGKRRDPLTGAIKGTFGSYLVGHNHCQRSVLVPPYFMNVHGIKETPLELKSQGAAYEYQGSFRAPCGPGRIPAYGMLYLAQTNCRCIPGQPFGFLALGFHGGWPDEACFRQARPVEKGPAFGQIKATGAAPQDWPTYRHDSARTNHTTATAPEALKVLWRITLAEPEGVLSSAWKPQLTAPLSAPVFCNGKLLVASTDRGQLFALDPASGRQLWCKLLPSRIDLPPTVSGGVAYQGCHDGWLYAFRLQDGVLAWRSRIAPEERRMVAFGKVESNWPVVGSVVVQDEVVYANAGRTSDFEGGIALVALDAKSGTTRWARGITQALRVNDVLSLQDAQLAWHYVRYSLKDGAQLAPEQFHTLKQYGGGNGVLPGPIMDGSWTVSPNRRTRNAFSRGKLSANTMAWTDERLVTPAGAFSANDQALLWKMPLPIAYQVEQTVIAGSKVIAAGTIDAEARPRKGFVALVALADGKKISELILDTPPAYNGVIIAEGRLFVSLHNGQLLCLGTP